MLPAAEEEEELKVYNYPFFGSCVESGQGYGQGLGPGPPGIGSRAFLLNHGSLIVIPAEHLGHSAETCARKGQMETPALSPADQMLCACQAPKWRLTSAKGGEISDIQ